MTADILALKARLREEASARRKALPHDAAEAAALAVRDRILATDIVPPGATVSGFWPLHDEFDPRPALEALGARGHTLCLPVVVGKGRPLAFRAWAPGDPLERAAFGLSVPRWDAAPAVPNVLLVPLLAFDRRGYRLGYGGGYFDRTIETLRAHTAPVRAFGVGFAAQEVPDVPILPHDQGLDAVATERELIRIADFL